MKKKFNATSILAFSGFALAAFFMMAVQILQPTTVEAQSEKSNLLSFGVQSTKDSYVQLEPIPMTFTVVNRSLEPITWTAYLGIGPSVNLLVQDETGNQTNWEGSKLMPVLLGLVPMSIQPNQSHQTKTILDANLVEKIFPRPGRYTVRIELKYDIPAEEKQQKTVLSNPIAIEIKEPLGIDRQAYDYIKGTIKASKKKRTINKC